MNRPAVPVTLLMRVDAAANLASGLVVGGCPPVWAALGRAPGGRGAAAVALLGGGAFMAARPQARATGVVLNVAWAVVGADAARRSSSMQRAVLATIAGYDAAMGLAKYLAPGEASGRHTLR